MKIAFHPYNSDWVAQIRQGGEDDYGQKAERVVSDGGGNPCRHCLQYIPEGAEMLICAARPFPEMQPYAETGPIFLCGDSCEAFSGEGVPPVLSESPDYLLKGYNDDYRIVYGTGQITPVADVSRIATELLRRREVEFVDIRSSRNNCFQCRVRVA